MLEVNLQTGLPQPSALASLLGETPARAVGHCVQAALFAPVDEMMRRPSKRFRAELLRLGQVLGREDGAAPRGVDERTFSLCTQAIELLHAGSMIVDDIQDGSTVRRGAPAIHRLFGIPGALCAGNWLYFWPLRLIRDAGLDRDQEYRIVGIYCEAVEKAHYGQAVDLSVRVDDLRQEDVPSLVEGVSALKTGAVTELAISIGGVLAGAGAERVGAMAHFGRSFGMALQDLDDLGNLLGQVEPEKRHEDLLQAKPSGVWSHAARTCGADDYRMFVEAVRALRRGDGGELEAWLRRTDLAESMREATRQRLAAAFTEASIIPGLGKDHPAREALQRLQEVLLHAYC